MLRPNAGKIQPVAGDTLQSKVVRHKLRPLSRQYQVPLLRPEPVGVTANDDARAGTTTSSFGESSQRRDVLVVDRTLISLEVQNRGC